MIRLSSIFIFQSGVMKMGNLSNDMRYGARMIKKNPGFAVVAVLAAALGIAANTFIFSVVDALVLRPFSFPNEARLVALFERKQSIGVGHSAVSPGNVIEWQAHSKTLQEIVAMRSREYTLSGDGLPERYTGTAVSAAFFDAIGVRAQLGRTFLSGEDEAGRAEVAVLRYDFWQKRFGGDPRIVGKQILLDDKPFTVIGVMPEDFDFPYNGGELWAPLVFDPKMKQDHSGHYLRVLGLLKPGVSLAQADADLDRMAKRIEKEFPDGEAGHSAYAVALNVWYTRGVRVALPALIGSAIFVLLIACSNVANLLLVRATARQKEIAVRLALGATRGRLIGQLLTESVMLALGGAVLGVLFAAWAIDAPYKITPVGMSKFIPGWNHMGLNTRVLTFTTLIAVLTGVLFGLAPALQATKTNVHEALKEGGKGTPGKIGRSAMRHTLVVCEVALSMVLLIGAGVSMRSFMQILRADLGIKPDHVVTMNLALPYDKYPEPQQRRNFFDELLTRIASLPGVAKAGAVHSLPMSSGGDSSSFRTLGQPSFEQGREPHTEYRIATPDYFTTIGTELRQGRLFRTQDNANAPRVALVNEAFAARFLRGADAVGQRIILGNDKETPLEIIGVVVNVMNDDLDDLAEPCVYLPFAQFPVGGMNLVIRSPGVEEKITPAVRRELAALDASLALGEVRMMTEMVRERRSPKEMLMWSLGIFGLMALAMAAVGTYAVMAYSVAQRTHEFGVRIALGAQTSDILRLVLQRGLTLALIGIGLGLAGAFAVTRVLAKLLYGVTATDPLTFAGVSLALTCVSALACWIPARRATKVDPMVALRCD
jgi:putative ABC transport system permease protein